MISAKIILDSISSQGHRLTTFQLRYPKFIHGEFMTHRVFSRNASSSRAIPVRKNIEEVRDDALRAAPIYWGAEQKGMQSGKELSDERTQQTVSSPKEQAQYRWRRAALSAAEHAETLVEHGVHKSIVNRILEPFLHINVVCTATEYMNFFGLRLDKAAQPEMRVLAETTWKEYGESKPRLLQPGEWHLPFVDLGSSSSNTFHEYSGDDGAALTYAEIAGNGRFDILAIKVSVARCARVSYLNFDTGRRSSVEEDLKLYDRLVGSQPVHASPAEHQATPDDWVQDDNVYSEDRETVVKVLKRGKFDHQWGNLIGWRQYRKMLPGENLAPLPPEHQK